MKWYRITDQNNLVNLSLVENIKLIENAIVFYFYGEEDRYLKESFETKEEAEHRFKLIASILEDQFFQNN